MPSVHIETGFVHGDEWWRNKPENKDAIGSVTVTFQMVGDVERYVSYAIIPLKLGSLGLRALCGNLDGSHQACWETPAISAVRGRFKQRCSIIQR